MLGRRLVQQFSARGDTVYGLVRSPESARRVEALGGLAVSADVFDPEALASALMRTEQELLQQLADRERAAAEAADDPLQRLLQNHGVRSIAWRAAQLPTDQHRDKVAEWLDMLLESVKRPES